MYISIIYYYYYYYYCYYCYYYYYHYYFLLLLSLSLSLLSLSLSLLSLSLLSLYSYTPHVSGKEKVAACCNQKGLVNPQCPQLCMHHEEHCNLNLPIPYTTFAPTTATILLHFQNSIQSRVLACKQSR